MCFNSRYPHCVIYSDSNEHNEKLNDDASTGFHWTRVILWFSIVFLSWLISIVCSCLLTFELWWILRWMFLRAVRLHPKCCFISRKLITTQEANTKKKKLDSEWPFHTIDFHELPRSFWINFVKRHQNMYTWNFPFDNNWFEAVHYWIPEFFISTPQTTTIVIRMKQNK